MDYQESVLYYQESVDLYKNCSVQSGKILKRQYVVLEGKSLLKNMSTVQEKRLSIIKDKGVLLYVFPVCHEFGSLRLI